MPRASPAPRLDDPIPCMVHCAPGILGPGVKSFVQNQATVRVHGVARSVLDGFQFRNQVGVDIALEALRFALADTKTTVDEIWHFAALACVAIVMRPFPEAVP